MEVRHKLVFSFLLTIDICRSEGHLNQEEWYFLLTGGVAVGDNPFSNPTKWLSDKGWGELCRVSELAAFKGLRESFAETVEAWQIIYDSPNPHTEVLPGHWDKQLTTFHKMLACALQNEGSYVCTDSCYRKAKYVGVGCSKMLCIHGPWSTMI